MGSPAMRGRRVSPFWGRSGRRTRLTFGARLSGSGVDAARVEEFLFLHLELGEVVAVGADGDLVHAVAAEDEPAVVGHLPAVLDNGVLDFTDFHALAGQRFFGAEHGGGHFHGRLFHGEVELVDGVRVEFCALLGKAGAYHPEHAGGVLRLENPRAHAVDVFLQPLAAVGEKEGDVRVAADFHPFFLDGCKG